MGTLCTNCENSQTCSWKNNNVVFCNEHSISVHVPNNTIKENHNKKQNHKVSTSLCNTCFLVADCHFYQKNLNTIFCEEYQ